MGASDRPHRGIHRRRTASWLLPLAMLVVLLVLGVPGAGAFGPSLSVSARDSEGDVTVTGEGFDGPVWLYQCWDTPTSEDDVWAFCDQTTAKEVHNPNGESEFWTKEVIGSGEVGFPPGTENWIGNHTYDCEAADQWQGKATCWVVATNDWQSFTSAEIPFDVKYGPLEKAVVTGPTGSALNEELTDGQLVRVVNPGHRPGTQAMAYACAGYGKAFPGGCDPIPASERTIPDGSYMNNAVPLPRFVWVNPPEVQGAGAPSWYDCADGCSVLVASADNVVSEYWEQETETLLRFRAEPMEKNPELLTVTRVRVNKMGGITIEGKIDCTQAIAQWGQSAFVAGVNVTWKARQPIGRKGAVTAHYESAILSLCHNPLDPTPLYPWATHPPITSSAIWWVYPDTGGKFATGAMHVDVQVTGGSWSTSPGADRYLLTGVTQWDGKAVRG